MKLSKLLLKTFALFTILSTSFFVSCKNTDDEPEEKDLRTAIEKAAPGSVITINGEEIVVLENTYYVEKNRSVASASRAVQVEGLSDEQNKLILKYMENVKVQHMLNELGINNYIQGWKKGDVKLNMPYQNGGVIYASDFFYYFDKEKRKIAQFQLNWESGKIYKAITGAASEVKNLEAIQKFEEMAGLPVTQSLPSGRYNYSQIDTDKYAKFRTDNDPNVFKCQSFPENIDSSKLSEKKEIQYTFKYVTEGEGESVHVKVENSDFSKDKIDSWYKALYYKKINNTTFSAYYDYPEIKRTTTDGSSTYLNRQFSLRENGGYMFYTAGNLDYISGSNTGENNVKATSIGKGIVGGTVTEAEYKNETQLRTNLPNQYLELRKAVTGSALTGADADKKVNYMIRLDKTGADKTKDLTDQTVRFYENSTFVENLTFAQAVQKYFKTDIILSSETTEINGWKLPSIIRIRATMLKEGYKGHNKKYLWIKAVPESRGDAFIYKLAIDEKLEGNDVPENVKIFAENLKTIFENKTYNEDYLETQEIPVDTSKLEIGDTVNFASVLTTDFIPLNDGTIGETRDSSGYRSLTGLWKVQGLNIKSTMNSTSSVGCIRLHVLEDPITKMDRINFNGDSIFAQEDSKNITTDDIISIADAKGYIKIPFEGTGTLKFKGLSSNAANCGKFVVTDSNGTILLAESAASPAKEYSVTIKGDAYLLFSREKMTKPTSDSDPTPLPTGGAQIYKIWVE